MTCIKDSFRFKTTKVIQNWNGNELSCLSSWGESNINLWTWKQYQSLATALVNRLESWINMHKAIIFLSYSLLMEWQSVSMCLLCGRWDLTVEAIWIALVLSAWWAVAMGWENQLWEKNNRCFENQSCIVDHSRGWIKLIFESIAKHWIFFLLFF